MRYANEPRSADHADDFLGWSKERGRRLREPRPGSLDRERLADEIESLGRSQPEGRPFTVDRVLVPGYRHEPLRR
jgi:hypothetical protein